MLRTATAVTAALIGGAAAVPADDPPEPDRGALQGQIEEAITRGIAFLTETQNKDGSWGSAHRTKGLNIYAPVPGAHRAFRAATTGLCVQALIETGAARDDQGAADALELGESWLIENLPYVRRATGDAIYNVWAHAYGTSALAACLGRHDGPSPKQDAILEVITTQIDLLTRYESVDGGWGYYDFRYQTKQPSSSSISFTTATGLVALKDARNVGAEVPDRLVERALAAVQRQRKNDGSFLYGEYLKYSPLHPVNRPGGSLGRTQACYHALRLWGDATVDDASVEEWLDRLVERNGWLDIGRKRPVPHESWFAVAGYFFYYGHYYAALVADSLEDDRGRPYLDSVASIIVPLQETDGSWWDFPFYNYHQPYGTGFALMTLARCR